MCNAFIKGTTGAFVRVAGLATTEATNKRVVGHTFSFSLMGIAY